MFHLLFFDIFRGGGEVQKMRETGKQTLIVTVNGVK